LEAESNAPADKLAIKLANWTGPMLWGEAVWSAVDGGRRWPRDVAAIPFIVFSMRGIIWNERKRKRRFEPLDPEIGTADPAPSTVELLEQEERERALRRSVSETLASQPNALAVALGRLEGLRGGALQTFHGSRRHLVCQRLPRAQPRIAAYPESQSMSDDPKKTVDDLIDKLVDEELALSDDELEAALRAEGEDSDSSGVEAPLDAFLEGKREGRAATRPRPATTRSTSGVAYEFEDYIAASLLVRSMAGSPMPGFHETGACLRFQTRALGWAVDDLLFTSEGEASTLALSCKSSLQVGPAGFPQDFTAAVWSDWQGLDGQHRQSVMLALVTRGRHDGFEKVWADIKDWLSNGVTTLALARIGQSAQHKRVFDSLRRDEGRSEQETGELIQSLLLIATDFQLDVSTDEERAIERCQQLLVSGFWKDAQALWRALLSAAREARTGHGQIDVAQLWGVLRTHHDLRDHPDLASSWETLRQINEDRRERIVPALPNGHVLDRESDKRDLAELLRQSAFCGLHGESGVGKSALVASTLDAFFPECSQVWLSANDLNEALSASGRSSIGLKHPLQRVLLGSSKPQNVLVLDGVESLPEEAAPLAKRLIETLLSENAAEAPAWRVLVVSQSERGATMREALGLSLDAQKSLSDLTADQVREALASSERLRWLASHDDAVMGLRNLKALSFVMQAEGLFAAEGPNASFSRSAIADRLWSWWTGDKAAMDGLLVRLAVRDASFERSVAVSELSAGEAQAFDQRTLRTPLRINRLKRIEFTHDLAADWSRYQRLREMAFDVEKWAPLADNPIWLPALRMLGEFLLREKVEGEAGWDVAFRKLEGMSKGTAAKDVLLDALSLDPLAEQFLHERGDKLLANDGALLLRLVQRFLHVATVPAVPAHVLALDPTLRLQFEAHHRAPIIGRWFAMVRFLDSRRGAVARLMSPEIARLCEIWLTSVPSKVDGWNAVPLRQELAALALATARALQVAQGTHRYILRAEDEQPIYKAAFAGSPDLPDEIAGWALEMCGRRDVDAGVLSSIDDFHRKEAQARLERMRSDPAFRLQQQRKRAMASFPHFHDRELPPWPLGPRREVEDDFRNVCLHKGGLNELMKVRPAAAGEILLACIIDDAPTERHDRGIDRYLGLAYDHEAYPTIYWSSPFLMLLWVNADQALRDLLTLVDFSTERWAEPSNGKAYKVEIELSASGHRSFTGNYSVFEWSEAESLGSGQLSCALASLEFWLCAQLDASQDINAVLEQLLLQSNSAAILGVLVNVGKHKPDLFKGALKPLLTSRELYRWDDHRVRDKRGFRFNVMHWARAGERAFEMAKTWAFARRHEISLSQVAYELVVSDDEVAAFLKAAGTAWHEPEDEKDRLELRLLAAQLDRDNYVAGEDGELTFRMPEALERDVDAFNAAHAPKRVALTLPMQCLNFLGTGADLSERDSANLAEVLSAKIVEHSSDQGEDEADDEEEDGKTQRFAQIAAAGTLLARGRGFLAANSDVARRATEIIEAAAREIGDDVDSLRKARFAFSSYDVLFVAYAAIEGWSAEPEGPWPKLVLRLISSRREGVISTLVRAARGANDQLGDKARALQNAALLWSALSALSPSYDDDDLIGRRWENWLRRFRELALPKVARIEINLSQLAERVDRLAELRRSKKNPENDYDPPSPPRTRGRKRALRTGLDNEVLAQVYDEVLNHRRAGGSDTGEDRAAVLALWQLYTRTLEEYAEEDGEYSLPDRLGYEVVNALARMSGYAPADEASKLWRSILELGPKGYHAVDYFLGLWFLHPGRGVDRAHFLQQWRQMIEFVCKAGVWNGEQLWYRREHTMRQVLGFGSHDSLVHLADGQAAVASLWNLYESWAQKHLEVDEDNITGFAYFLASDVAQDIRVRGVVLLGDQISNYSERTYWRRDRAGSALVDLAEAVLAHHSEQMKSDQALRDAVLRIVATLAAKNTTGALVLQERIRGLK
jgi:hypothetical protein